MFRHLVALSRRGVNLSAWQAASATTTTPRVMACPPPSRDLLVRHFAKKKGTAKQGGGTKNVAKVYTAWTGDVEEVPELHKYESATNISLQNDNLQQFTKAYRQAEELESDEALQIYNSQTKAFEPLTEMEQIKVEQSKKGKVYLAPLYEDEDEFPDDYDGEEEYDEDYRAFSDDDDDDDDNDVGQGMHMRASIQRLIAKLRHEGWDRHENGQQMTRGSETRATKQLILDLAQEDEDLQDTLLARVGALDHMATCVHFDFAWDAANENGDDDDDGDDLVEASFVEKKE